jgi:hypothetical protein
MAKKKFYSKFLIRIKRFLAMLYLILPVKTEAKKPGMRVIYRKKKSPDHNLIKMFFSVAGDSANDLIRIVSVLNMQPKGYQKTTSFTQ